MTSVGSHTSNVWAKTTDLQVVSGHGCRVVDVDGNEYLDFTAGIAAASTGHCHPRVVQAIAEQATRFIHAQQNVYTHDLLEPLAAKLDEITPPSIDTFFFANSSDEVLEVAVKVAKHATGRHNIVVFDGAFHGRTHLTMAMSTARAIDRAGYGPFPPGVFVAPFPDPHVSDQEAEISRALRGFDRLLQTQVVAEEIAAIVVEPVISERGYIPTPAGFMFGLAERCRDHGILLIADEVQSGFGRTGKMFAIEAHDVEPDMLCMAKGIASGFPFAALGMRGSLDASWRVGSQGGSGNGNPIGCAAALATIEVLTGPGFLDNVHARGEQLIDELLQMQQLDMALRYVRGRGLMVATEFDTPERAEAVVAHCLREHRVILMTAGTRNRTVRWMPPLIVTSDEVYEATQAFASAIRATG
ncbi:MAG TPA: aspartate aminotransferase family protein [Ilumatobacteraceae bacterium]|nr:aspartate aminotransferase family protein [Ilumatobacteraceae bacterium]